MFIHVLINSLILAQRYMSDSLVALCVSGPTSFGKSKSLDSCLSTVSKVICMDSKGVGRYSSNKVSLVAVVVVTTWPT